MRTKKPKASNELATDRHTAAYARDAAVQPEQSSLEAQVDACVHLAAEDGAPPVGAAYVFRDRQSGAELHRPGLNQLRRAVQAGEVGVLYIRSLDRLSRNSQHLLALRHEFASAGVELRFVWHTPSDTGLPGRALYGYEYWQHGAGDEPGTGGEVFNPVKLMFELVSAGWSFKRIAAELNRMGFPSDLGQRWDA